MISKLKSPCAFGTLEIILSLMVLIPLLIGFLDFANRLSTQFLLDEAASQGAEYLMLAPRAFKDGAGENKFLSASKLNQTATKVVEQFLSAADQRINFNCNGAQQVFNCAKIEVSDAQLIDSMSPDPSKKVSGHTVIITYKVKSILSSAPVILSANASRVSESNLLPENLPELHEISISTP